MFTVIRKNIFTSLFVGLLVASQSGLCVAKSVQDIKAVYFYNFIKFITWPSDNEGEFINVCLLGKDPINQNLIKLDSLSVFDRKIKIFQISHINNQPSCHVLFIGSSEEKFLSEIFSKTNNDPILTVSNINQFAAKGGTIGFLTLGNVIRFNVNLKQANDVNLAISSKLLKIANQVVR